MKACAAGLLATSALLWAGSGAAGADPVPERPRARPTTQEFKAAVAETQARLRDVCVTYTLPYDPAAHAALPPGAYVHRTLALKSPCFFFLESGHGCAAYDWQDDPKRQRVYVTEGPRYADWVYHRTYEVTPMRPDERLSGKLEGDLFFLATGWWPPGYRRPPPRGAADRPLVLGEVVGSTAYALRPEPEYRDGHWCQVLESPGVEVLYFDADRPGVLLEREHFGAGGVRKQKFLLRDYREVRPGVWLPYRLENIHYAYEAATPEEREKVRVHIRATVLEARANSLDDSFFRFDPLPGALLMDRRTGEMRQTHPGGLDYLESHVRRVRPDPPARAGPGPASLAWFAGLPLLALIGVFEAWTRRHRPR
jgi:hypothetical protein